MDKRFLELAIASLPPHNGSAFVDVIMTRAKDLYAAYKKETASPLEDAAE